MKHRATKRMLSGCLSAALVLQIAATVPALAVDAENNQGFSVDSLTLQPGETQSQINLNWYAPEGTTSAQVRFGDQVFTASVGALTAPTKLDEGKYTDTGKLVCKATVYDLSPDTEYQYAVSYDGGATWSQEYTYQTADDDSFTFAFTSDPQIKEDQSINSDGWNPSDGTNQTGWAIMMQTVAEAGASLMVSAGRPGRGSELGQV